MYKAVALTSIAALAGQTMALNAHRHQHQMDKRAVETDWCTVWETVTVTVDPSASTPAGAAATSFAAQDVPNPTGPAGGNNAGVVPTVTSTATVVVASSTAAASSPAAPATKHSTTLTTAVRQTSAAPVKSSTTPVAASSAPASSAPASSAPASSAPASSAPASSSPAPPSTSQTPTPTPTPSSSSKAAPPSSSTSQAAAPTKPATPPPSSGGAFPSKRGMAYNDGNLANTFGAASGGKIGWAYNWGFWPSGIDTSKYSYAPTLWGPQAIHSDGFDAQAEAALASGSKVIFSFNEADIASQSNLAPPAAASAQAQFLSKYAGRALIAAPSVSNSNLAGQGLEWLQSFVDVCATTEGCSFDICNVHWYSPPDAIETLFDHIEGASKICGGKPVVLTEYAPVGCSDAEIVSFLEAALPRLDALDSLIGYSYFMVGTGNLMSSATGLSDYGITYATA